jgi:hypothetical protein
MDIVEGRPWRFQQEEIKPPRVASINFFNACPRDFPATD